MKQAYGEWRMWAIDLEAMEEEMKKQRILIKKIKEDKNENRNVN